VLPRRTAEILEEICQLARELTPVGVLESAAFELSRPSAERGAKGAEHVRIVLQGVSADRDAAKRVDRPEPSNPWRFLPRPHIESRKIEIAADADASLARIDRTQRRDQGSRRLARHLGSR
jgi:hypothetical protein